MKELNDKEIDRISELIERINVYKCDTFDSWSDFLEARGLYIIRHEILAMYKLYEELGITIDFKKMCAADFSDEDWYSEEEQEECETIMQMMVFPSEKIMKENGWEETDIYIDGIDSLSADFEENEDEEDEAEEISDKTASNSLYSNTFGECADVLTKTKEFLDDVLNDVFVSDGAWTMKNHRAGLYMDYANNHHNIRNTKLHKQIMMCIGTITQPFIYHYVNYDEMVIKNQCVYAFTTSGYFEYGEGEFIGVIHGNTTRYLCVELLSVLLTIAENKYGYIKSNS